LNIKRAINDKEPYLIFIKTDQETKRKTVINPYNRTIQINNIEEFEKKLKSPEFRTPTLQAIPIFGNTREYIEEHYPQIQSKGFSEVLNQERIYLLTITHGQESFLKIKDTKGTPIIFKTITEDQFTKIFSILKPLTDCGAFLSEHPLETKLTYPLIKESHFGKKLIKHLETIGIEEWDITSSGIDTIQTL
jgi:hypothetical protein